MAAMFGAQIYGALHVVAKHFFVANESLTFFVRRINATRCTNASPCTLCALIGQVCECVRMHTHAAVDTYKSRR